MICLERYYDEGEMRMMIFKNFDPIISVTDATFNKETNLYDVVDQIKVDGSIINVYFSFDLKFNPVGIVYNDYSDKFTLLNNLKEYDLYRDALIKFIREDKRARVERLAQNQEKFVKVRKKVPNEKR